MQLAPMFSRSKLWLAALFALVWLLWVAPVLAQGGSVKIDDPDGLFGNGSAVKAAAQRLAGDGVDVVVVGARNAGANQTAALAYLDNRLQQLNIAQSTRALRGNQIVFFVAPTPGFDGLYYVGRYRQKLDPAYRNIQAQQMRPRFTSGDFSGGMAAGIDGVRTTLYPPVSPVVWAGAAVLALGVIGIVALPMLRSRRAASDALAAARDRMEQARRAAGVALADLGRRVTSARDKAQYDKLSYSAGDAARITELQQAGEARFTAAQNAFDAAEQARTEAKRLAVSDYDGLATQYTNAQQLAGEARQTVEEAERMRATLDAQTAPSTGETQRL